MIADLGILDLRYRRRYQPGRQQGRGRTRRRVLRALQRQALPHAQQHQRACLWRPRCGIELAKMIVDEWLDAEFEGGRHERRVNLLNEIDHTRGLMVADEA